MRAAPPVQMVCGREARWHAAVMTLGAGAAASAAAWASSWFGQSPACSSAAAGLAAAGAAILAVRSNRSSTCETLVWDGQVWRLQGRPGSVDVMIDLGGWLLLQFHADGTSAVRWLPVNLAGCGAPAHLCRAALLAHAAIRQTDHA